MARLITPQSRSARSGVPVAPKEPLFRSDFRAARPALDADGLAALAKRNPETFMARVEDLIRAGKFSLRSVRDLKSLFRAFFPINVKAIVDIGGIRSAVDTSAFPLLMGSLVVDEINRAYDEVPTIGQELVQDVESNKKFSHHVKIINNVDQELETKEGEEFPMISASEQFAVIGHKRKGFQLALSQETIDENDIGNFLELVDQGGQFAGELIEEQTLSRVSDQNGSNSSAAEPYVFRPNGSAFGLYKDSTVTQLNGQTPSGTRVLANALSSTANLDAVRLVLSAMLNTRGRRIAIPMSECILLVPDALLTTALKITESEMEPGVFNEANNWGPKGSFRPGIASSPKLDDVSTSAWYFGAPKRQFRRKHKIRLETVSVYSDPMTYARTREAYRTRVCWDMEIGATDNVFFVQSLSGDTSTAPALASTNP